MNFNVSHPVTPDTSVIIDFPNDVSIDLSSLEIVYNPSTSVSLPNIICSLIPTSPLPATTYCILNHVVYYLHRVNPSDLTYVSKSFDLLLPQEESFILYMMKNSLYQSDAYLLIQHLIQHHQYLSLESEEQMDTEDSEDTVDSEGIDLSLEECGQMNERVGL